MQLGSRLVFRSEYNFNETRCLALQSEQLQWFLLALTFCLLSGWWAVRLATSLVKFSKADSYRSVLAGHKREAIFCIAALCCFIAGIFWVKSSAFLLFLPQDFITNDSGIVDYIIGNFQLRNMKSSVFLCAFSSNAKIVLAVLDICFMVILLKIVYKMKSVPDDL